ncbi:MAG: energy-coupling factor transporter ATPase [Candidatus Merdivicinus sp.]|jgi:energy-coupling factor transport system ATP-binding protein
MMEPIINASQVFFEYQNEEDGTVFPVLKGINLKIRDGEFVAVLGHNGSGKSTFAKHCNAILLPTRGDVEVAGINTKEEDRLFDIRQNVGMVFQNPDNQIVATIVEEDVAFALENMGVEPAEIRRRVDEALKQVEMYEYREHAPHQLSGGQKQRVAIAGILAMRPRCIVLDEPTAMLDPKGRREVMKTIRQLNREHGTTVVLITHYMEEAAVSDRVVVIDGGEVLRDGTPKEVFSEVELLKSVGLDVPQVTELVYELRKEGVPLPQDILTEEECYEALKGLFDNKTPEGNDKD